MNTGERIPFELSACSAYMLHDARQNQVSRLFVIKNNLSPAHGYYSPIFCAISHAIYRIVDKGLERLGVFGKVSQVRERQIARAGACLAGIGTARNHSLNRQSRYGERSVGNYGTDA